MTTDDIRLLTHCAILFLFWAHFSVTKAQTKIGFFVTQIGPCTQVIDYSSLVKRWIGSKKAEELS